MAEPPMSIQWQLTAKKPISSSPLRTGEHRRVHDRVVQMLALHRGVVADDDVAFVIFSRP